MKAVDALKKYEEWLIRERKAELTRESYMGWAERYFAWSEENRAATAEETISNFLSSYSRHSEATVNQALNALVGKSGFFPAMGKKLDRLPPWVNPSRPANIPEWVTQAETEAILAHLKEPWAMMVGLLYGSGLRIGECMGLRWRDIDFERLTVTVRRGKGNKDRVTVLSERMVAALMERRERCRGLWAEDRERKRPGVALPVTVGRKAPGYAEDWAWFWVFPAAGESCDLASGIVRRHHVHKKSLAKPLRVAVRRSGVAKRVTAHTFRHGFATGYLLAGGNLRELQRLLGHANMETTEIYLHCLPSDMDRIGSPWDVPVKARAAAGNVIRFEGRRSA